MPAATKTPAALNGMKPLDEYVLGHAKLALLPVAKLEYESYQREPSEGMVDGIVAGYDSDRMEPLTVNARDGRYIVVDGRHRREALLRLHEEFVLCRLLRVDAKREAEIYVLLNRERRWMNPVQTFRGELAYGNPAAIEIERCLADRGLRVDSSHTPSTIGATRALKRIYAASGRVGLGKTLDTIELSWPEDEPRRFAGRILEGIHAFIARSGGEIDLNVLGERLAKTTPLRLLAKGQERWHAWQALDSKGASQVEALVETIGAVYRKR